MPSALIIPEELRVLGTDEGIVLHNDAALGIIATQPMFGVCQQGSLTVS